VVVDDLDIGGPSDSPREADAPLLIDSDAVLAFPVASQFLQPVPGRDPEVVEQFSGIEHRQLPQCRPAGGVVEPSMSLPSPDALGLLVGEGDQHAR
jgi:hypothetical protein